MKLLTLTVLFLAFAAYEVRSQSCHMREMDLCMAVGMLQYQSYGIPADAERLDEWCETIKEVRECTGNYSEKCMSPVQREVMGLLAGSDANARQLCIEGSEVRARFLTHAECLSEGADSDDFRKILRDLQVFVEKLFKVEFKNRFPLLCCGIRRLYGDIETFAEERCGKDAVEMVKTMIFMVVGNLPGTICQRYDPLSDTCQTLLPPRGSPMTSVENMSQLTKLLGTVFGDVL